MKVAVTSTGDTVNATVDPRFGRAEKFIVLDTDTGEVQVVDNTQNVNLAQGAGIQAAENISQLGVQYVITGNCGPKAFRTLSAAGIKVVQGASGTISEAVEQLKTGKLVPAESHNVDGHWM